MKASFLAFAISVYVFCNYYEVKICLVIQGVYLIN